MQAVADRVVPLPGQLRLDGVMQKVTDLRLHQARVGRVDQGTQLMSRLAQVTLAGRVEKQQRPAGFVQAFEAQHAEPGWHWQLRHNLGRQTRSEEHTSELQSRENLVCRLLLEKKKSH